MKKNSCGSKIPHPPHNFSNGPSLMEKHVFTFTTISNNVQQMDLKTNVMATNGARASFFLFSKNNDCYTGYRYIWTDPSFLVMFFYIRKVLYLRYLFRIR